MDRKGTNDAMYYKDLDENLEHLWWLLLNVVQNRCSQKFCDIHKKMSVLDSLINKVTGLMACNLIEKETPTQVFFSEYCKIFKDVLLEMVEEFQRISNLTLERFVKKIL